MKRLIFTRRFLLDRRCIGSGSVLGSWLSNLIYLPDFPLFKGASSTTVSILGFVGTATVDFVAIVGFRTVVVVRFTGNFETSSKHKF
jgi:hypothetical protein